MQRASRRRKGWAEFKKVKTLGKEREVQSQSGVHVSEHRPCLSN